MFIRAFQLSTSDIVGKILNFTIFQMYPLRFEIENCGFHQNVAFYLYILNVFINLI